MADARVTIKFAFDASAFREAAEELLRVADRLEGKEPADVGTDQKGRSVSPVAKATPQQVAEQMAEDGA